MAYRFRSHPRSFEQAYRCYAISSVVKLQLENSNKILMPMSALDRLASLQIEYPMQFLISNPSSNRSTHCGVMEFTAEEGSINMPGWMMQNLLLKDGDLVRIKNVSLPQGQFVKLQPHTKNFLDISDQRAVLEKALRSFSCLTTGDTIVIDYNNKKYYINILETKPSDAVSIIDTDCEVDFVAPLDYVEPEKSSPPQAPSGNIESKPSSFTGLGRRLDGTPSRSPITAASIRPEKSNDAPASVNSKAKSSAQASRMTFGSKVKKDLKQIGIENGCCKNDPEKDEEPKFVAFTGRKYSLKD